MRQQHNRTSDHMPQDMEVQQTYWTKITSLYDSPVNASVWATSAAAHPGYAAAAAGAAHLSQH